MLWLSCFFLGEAGWCCFVFLGFFFVLFFCFCFIFDLFFCLITLVILMFDSCNCFLYCYFYLKKKETVNYDTEKIYIKKKAFVVKLFHKCKIFSSNSYVQFFAQLTKMIFFCTCQQTLSTAIILFCRRLMIYH